MQFCDKILIIIPSYLKPNAITMFHMTGVNEAYGYQICMHL